MSINIFSSLLQLLLIYKFQLYLLIFSMVFYPMIIKSTTSFIEDDVRTFIIHRHPNESLEAAINNFQKSVHSIIANATLFIVLGSWVAYWYPKIIIQSGILFIGFIV